MFTAHIPPDCRCDEAGTQSSTTCPGPGLGPGRDRQWLNKQNYKHTQKHRHPGTDREIYKHIHRYCAKPPHRQTLRQTHRHEPENLSMQRDTERPMSMRMPTVSYGLTVACHLVGTPVCGPCAPNPAPQVRSPACVGLLHPVVMVLISGISSQVTGSPGRNLWALAMVSKQVAFRPNTQCHSRGD